MIIASDLVPLIKKLAESFLEEIGDDDTVQNSFIFQYLTHALRLLAHIAYQQRDSDVQYISSDGTVIFQAAGVDITNMYSPLRIIDPTGRDMQKRVSSADGRGWWRESSNTQINIKGYGLATNPLPPGNHTLKYLAYPEPVISLSSPVQFPDAGSMGLCYFVTALILESRPSAKDLVDHYKKVANGHLKVAVQANIDARGISSGGYVPNLATVDLSFGGA